MDAVICQRGELRVEDRPEPVPGKGQVRLEVIRCGICGSDLHARHGMDQWADLVEPVAPHGFMRSEQPIVFGHEFSGTVAEHGPGCKKELAEGARVVALPLLRGSHGVGMTGLSEQAPGAYAQQVLAEESLLFEVPNGLDPAVAALTEPLSVAWHAVRRGERGGPARARVASGRARRPMVRSHAWTPSSASVVSCASRAALSRSRARGRCGSK